MINTNIFKEIIIGPFFLRLIAYLSIWFFYTFYMHAYAPLGIGWLDWHQQTISNFVDFLEINGLFSFNGFSIWSSCEECDLDSNYWVENIYITRHSISYFPYLILNHLFNKEFFLILASMLDKFIIFITGLIISELAVILLRNSSSLPKIIISGVCFSLFIINPWTYKMFIAGWTEVYFLAFTLFGLFAFSFKYYRLGLVFFFCAGIFHYQWATLILFFYMVILTSQLVVKDPLILINYLPTTDLRINIKTAISLFIPIFGYLLARTYTEMSLSNTEGSRLLYRIGISGDDIHNGGLLGSLQFLAGNRVSKCIEGMDLSMISMQLDMKIALFNCLLSLGTMLVISIIAIIGALKLIKLIDASRKILVPLLFALITMICIFQQSLSVHLMGYSYIFSVFFALGLTTMLLLSFDSIKSNIIKTCFIAPIVVGILITCIRVSFLTGAGV